MGWNVASIPQPALSWPEFPNLLLLGLGLNLLIFGVNISKPWRIASRRQVTALLVLCTLITCCGYYLMDGIAQPLEHALEQWQASQAPSASCSPLALQNALSPTFESTHRLYVIGLLVYLAANLIWSAASVVWSYRRACTSPGVSRAA